MSVYRHLMMSFVALNCVAMGACTVYSTPAPATAEVVEEPPPEPAPPPAEVVPPPPSPEHVWIPAYHRWNGRAYVVVRGHYERRPRANARYERGHWERRGRGKVWVDGRWD